MSAGGWHPEQLAIEQSKILFPKEDALTTWVRIIVLCCKVVRPTLKLPNKNCKSEARKPHFSKIRHDFYIKFK